MNYYIGVLKKYAVFKGRARRSELWYFILFNFIIGVVLTLVGSLVGFKNTLANIYSLAVLIPGIAVIVRRLHDIGKSGWMILIGLIPIAGVIWLIVLNCLDSNPGDNKYGPNPKAGSAPETPMPPTPPVPPVSPQVGQ